MPRRTPEEAAQTRQALLLAALDVFSEKGVAGGTLKEIAARAGVTHGALYWHFGNRQVLLESLFEQVSLPCDRHYLEQRQAAKQQALEALEAYLLGLAGEIGSNPEAQKVYRLFYSGSDTSTELTMLAPRRERVLEEIIGQIQFFLKQARKQGLIGLKKRELDSAARSICCLLLGLLQSRLLAPDLFSIGNDARQLVQSCLRGL